MIYVCAPQHTHQHKEVVSSLTAAIDARLLKPGADTSNIIQVMHT